jgi:hypothetical protein
LLSNNGHLDENGNQLSGREHDIYLGPGFDKTECGKLPPPPKQGSEPGLALSRGILPRRTAQPARPV